ncbi:unnamed protein product, partial [Prorocentrum cordatum]
SAPRAPLRRAAHPPRGPRRSSAMEVTRRPPGHNSGSRGAPRGPKRRVRGVPKCGGMFLDCPRRENHSTRPSDAKPSLKEKRPPGGQGARQRPQECRPGARAARARGGARTRRRAPLSGPPRRAASRGGPASAGRWRRPPA